MSYIDSKHLKIHIFYKNKDKTSSWTHFKDKGYSFFHKKSTSLGISFLDFLSRQIFKKMG